jgi:hypothetical protein
MTTFAMRGHAGPLFHGTYCSAMEIRGRSHCSGPQLVSDDGGVPTAVKALFDAMPQVDRVALIREDGGGAVYSRMKDQP